MCQETLLNRHIFNSWFFLTITLYFWPRSSQYKPAWGTNQKREWELCFPRSRFPEIVIKNLPQQRLYTRSPFVQCDGWTMKMKKEPPSPASTEFWLFLTQIQIYNWSPSQVKLRLYKRTNCGVWIVKMKQRDDSSTSTEFLIWVLTSLWWNQFPSWPLQSPYHSSQKRKTKSGKNCKCCRIMSPISHLARAGPLSQSLKSHHRLQ